MHSMLESSQPCAFVIETAAVWTLYRTIKEHYTTKVTSLRV